MNKPELITSYDLPDVASRELHQPHVTLDWVGMSDIHQPLLVRDGEQTKHVQTKVQIYVDLSDELAKGIHMSRLYLILDEHSETRPLTPAGLKLLLRSVLVPAGRSRAATTQRSAVSSSSAATGELTEPKPF